MANGFRNAVGQDEAVKKTSMLASCSLTAILICILFVIASLFSSPKSYSFKFRASFCLAVAAIILGIAAILVIEFSHKNLKGRSYAWIALVLAFLYIIMGMNSVARFMSDKVYTTEYNLRLLSTIIGRYAGNNKGYLPTAERWCDELMEYNKSLSRENFSHPRVQDRRIAFNKNLSGLRLSDVGGDVVLLFEADGGWNLNGGTELLEEMQELNDTYVLFVDGSIYNYRFKDRGVLKWDSNSEETFIEPLRWKPRALTP